VVALLHGVECGKELEERFVACAFASEPHESCDGEAEGLQVNFRVVAADELETLEAAQALGGGGGGEADASAELGYAEASVGGQLSKNLAVDLVDSSVEKHVALLGFVPSGERE